MSITFYQGFICGVPVGFVAGIIVLALVFRYVSKAPVDDGEEWG